MIKQKIYIIDFNTMFNILDEHNKKVSHWAENQHNNNATTAVGGTQGSTALTGTSTNDT